MIEVPFWLAALIPAFLAMMGIVMQRFAGRRKAQPRPQPTAPDLVETDPGAIEDIDDDPTPTVGPRLDPVEFPDDDPVVVDQLGKWTNDV
jgi:hypothetical protein